MECAECHAGFPQHSQLLEHVVESHGFEYQPVDEHFINIGDYQVILL
jgi:hypothetical protein